MATRGFPVKTPFIITNSRDCRCILLEAGMLNELNPKPPVNTTSVTFRHAGYTWLAVNHTGHANPKDDGYTLIGLPEEIGEQETQLFFAECIGERASVSEAMEFEALPAQRQQFIPRQRRRRRPCSVRS
jgi:hypothetical protein